SCTALENITFDAYWMWVRDARSLNDTNFPWFVEWIEDWIGVDDYDVTSLHTVGLRAAGMVGALDFDVEAAYQFGDAGQVGFGFKPFLYGDDDAEFDAWGINAQVGYTFDMAWQPRPFLRYTFYEGEDNRGLSFWDWVNPFDRPKASVSFNRLFSNQMYNGYFDLQNDFSNGHVFMAGVVAHPTESLDLVVDVGYYLVDEPFSAPVTWNIGKWRVPIAPFLPWWTEENDDEIGWTTDVVLTYHYSEDLVFMGHWSHLFPGDGLTDGNFNAANGLLFTGGTDDDSGDFFTAETRLRF
ncbi:MAG: alginate export family protein, partial [Candidatus Hydrogenedentes bacterium]|nr:alginate export family protein [Candidatus Hydrogenedentota bacterium]